MPSDQPFDYPPGVDPDGYDAQTYLEGGTEEAMAAAARMDARQAVRFSRFHMLFLAGLPTGCGEQARRMAAVAEQFCGSCTALGIPRAQAAVELERTVREFPGAPMERVYEITTDRLAGGSVIPLEFLFSPSIRFCPHDRETTRSEIRDDHVVSVRHCPDCDARTLGLDREAEQLPIMVLTCGNENES